MKNKLFKLTALCMVVVGLASCQKNADVVGISADLARNKTMLGYYTYTALDTTPATMQASKKEYYLTRDEKGVQKGYYRESVMGNGASTDVSIPLTWESEMAADHLSMDLTVKLENGTSQQLKWADGIIYGTDASGKEISFSKSVANLSNIETQTTIYKQLENVVFEVSQISYHDHQVSKKHTGWKFDNSLTKTPADTASAKQEWIDYLEENYHDSIVMYMKSSYCPSGRIAIDSTIQAYYVDSVIDGKDTTVLFNLVYVNPKPKKGTNKHTIYRLSPYDEWGSEQENDRPKELLFSNMTFNRVGGINTAIFTWHKSEYSEMHYLMPGSADDTGSDSLFTFTATTWMVPDFTNMAKFDVLLFGQGDSTIVKYENGVEKVIPKDPMVDAYLTLNLSGYGLKMAIDSTYYTEVQQGGLKYRLKQ